MNRKQTSHKPFRDKGAFTFHQNSSFTIDMLHLIQPYHIFNFHHF